jgi:peptide/nickel transport system permease protein
MTTPANRQPGSADGPPKKSPGPWQIIWRKLLKNRVACTGGVILVVFYVFACFAGFISPYEPDESDGATAKSPPLLFGSYDLVEHEKTTKKGKKVKTFEREWSWFTGGIHFHDSKGEFTFRPHVHPIVEKQFEDEKGDVEIRNGCVDRTVSVPIEFFVRTEKPHEMFSVLGFFPIEGNWHLFGVKKPEGALGAVRVYLWGSDVNGRDIFTRLLYGAQISLSVGILCIMVTMTAGMIIGGLSGYLGGWVDAISMRVVEVVLSVPDLYLMIVLGGILREWRPGDKPLTSRQTYLVIVLIMAFIGWAGRARVIRGMVLSLKENDYVVAARALGVPTWRTITAHILPNTFSFAVVSATLAIPGYILGEVALSFLGFGIQEPEASWGNMLRDAQEATTLSQNPWLIVPGVFIFLTVLAYNFLGDGLRDAADPKAVIVRSMKKDLKAAKDAVDAKKK